MLKKCSLILAVLFIAVLAYGTVILYEYSEGESSTSETTWQDKLAVTKTIDPGGEYLMWYSCEIAGSSKQYGIAVQVTLDENEITRFNKVPNDAAEWYTVSGMRGTALSAGEHVFKIRYAVENASQTATIRRARLVVIKH